MEERIKYNKTTQFTEIPDNSVDSYTFNKISMLQKFTFSSVVLPGLGQVEL